MTCKWHGVAAPAFPSGSERQCLCYLEVSAQIEGPEHQVKREMEQGVNSVISP